MDRGTWRAAVHGLQPTLSLSMQYPAPGSRHTLICSWYYYIQILEEEMATHSSILAWRIPWAEQPGRLYIVHSVTESERLKQFSMHSGWLCGKESACNAGDMGSIPELGEPLQKEMATHSSIFVWEIPWREEYGG